MAAERRRVLVLVASMATVVGVAGTAVLLAGDPAMVRCGLLDRFGWLTPVVTGAVLGGATIVLLIQRRSGSADDTRTDVLACPSCERGILGQWRMCPYCGQMLTDVDAGRSGRGSAEA